MSPLPRSRPRRKRYTFVTTRPDGSRGRFDGLSYGSEADAIALLLRHGHSDIERWTAPAARFKVDTAALHEAKKLLGIKWPVSIRIQHNRSNQGRCSTYLGGTKPRHAINLTTDMDAERAGQVLWHELAHARWNEREAAEHGVRLAMVNHKRGQRVAYELRATEVDACEHEPMNDDLPLCREVNK